MILKRDYLKLSEVELEAYKKYKFDNRTHDENGNFILPNPLSVDDNEPNYIYKHDCLFPNHNISSLDIREDQNWFQDNLNKFIKTLKDSNTTERHLLNFIRDNKASFIITSVLRRTDFGHHELFVFPEFYLADIYKVDFLIIGRASGGYQFLFVELENPYGQITTEKGEFSVTINKGIKQVQDWKRWIPKNFNSIQQTLKKYKGPNEEFSKEFYELDIDRLHFMVIAGRRNDYNDLTNQIRREMLQNGNQIKLLHYDNVIELAEIVIKTMIW